MNYEADDQGYLLEPVFDDEAVRVIAAAEAKGLKNAKGVLAEFRAEIAKVK